jgi:hypothetical protein
MASVVLKMDVRHQIPLILGRPFLNTMKSICTKEFLILTKISSAVQLEVGSFDPPAVDAGK